MVCVSLMTEDAEHVFMCLLICRLYFIKQINEAMESGFDPGRSSWRKALATHSILHHREPRAGVDGPILGLQVVHSKQHLNCVSC